MMPFLIAAAVALTADATPNVAGAVTIAFLASAAAFAAVADAASEARSPCDRELASE